MLRNDNVWMSIGHLDHVLTVYSSMEYVTWKSPGPMCGSVGRIPRPDSCMSVSSWSKVPLLSTWSIAVPLCRPLLPCPSRWHGSLPWHGLWWLTCELHCSPLPWRLGSVYQLWKSNILIYWVIHFSLSPKFGLMPKISQKVKWFFVWTEWSLNG